MLTFVDKQDEDYSCRLIADMYVGDDIMRILTKVEMEKVSGGIIARIPFPGETGLRNASNPLNAARKPKGWAGAIVVLPPDTK